MTITTCSLQGKRSYQQDALGHAQYDGLTLLVLCDGMGGGGGDGAKVAGFVTDHIITAQPKTAKELKAAVLAAGTAVIKIDRGGTTCMAALIDGNQLHLASLGDSRTYTYRNKSLVQLTHDETSAQWLVDRGNYTQEDYDNGLVPGSNILTNCIGAGVTNFKVTLQSFALEPKEVILMASDGLWDGNNTPWLKEQLAKDISAGHLCQQALDAGSRDNISAITYVCN